MSVRTIRQCDRCRYELNAAHAAAAVQVTKGGETLDLCSSCENKLREFLGGRDLDEPP